MGDNHKKREREETPSPPQTDSNEEMELLSAWFCPYAQRAWMAMEIKCPGQFKVTEALKITSPDGVYGKDSLSRIPLLKESNPLGLVPVIIDRRSGEPASICDSLICVEYIDEVFGDRNGTTKLLPGGPAQRADARMWSNRLNDDIATTFYVLLLKQNKAEQEMAAEKMLNAWRDNVLKHPAFVATAAPDFEAMKRAYSRYADGTALIVKSKETLDRLKLKFKKITDSKRCFAAAIAVA
eukprot:scaffold3541_cov106-Skeletonema_menzelii.AAC.2